MGDLLWTNFVVDRRVKEADKTYTKYVHCIVKVQNPINKTWKECGKAYVCKQGNTSTLHYHLTTKHTSIATAIAKAENATKLLAEKEAEEYVEARAQGEDIDAYEYGKSY